MTTTAARIDRFEFRPGRVLGGKYEVEQFLGSGWEGEVYRVRELRTAIHRAAKLFYPQRNPADRTVKRYAKKLNRLRDCQIVIQYHHLETLRHRGTPVTAMISDLVEGEILEAFVARQRGRRLQPFEALHLLWPLVRGLEEMHRRHEYHGDLHDRNVLVKRRGIHFDVKLLDFYHWGRPDRRKQQEDLLQLVRVFYDAVGGPRHYARQPPEIKSICRGLRRDLILSRFPSAARLRSWLDSFSWDSLPA